ncbi:secreted protein [gut metagenome]|uniref:Secreted protein n=1 Tax=gut metagenome TaxID=749906 RepID=J9GUM0_9ZZZZ
MLPIKTHSSPASGFTLPNSLTGTSTPPAIAEAISTQ